MISLLRAVLVLSAVLQLIEGKAFARDNKTPGIMRLAVTAKTVDRSLRKRQLPEALLNDAKGFQYVIQFKIGNPAQNVVAAIDTASPETWVLPAYRAGDRPNSASTCRSHDGYDHAKSTTQSWSLFYGTGNVTGEFWTDDLHLGGATIKAQQSAVSDYSTSGLDGIGVMGLSYGLPMGTTYPAIVDQLVAQNITQSRAFSLDFRSVDTSEDNLSKYSKAKGTRMRSSIIFGGIDTKRFYGKLMKHAIISSADEVDEFPLFVLPILCNYSWLISDSKIPRYWINMTSLSPTLPPETSTHKPAAPKVIFDKTITAFLDSGTTLSYLPRSIVRRVAAAFPGAKSDGNGNYIVPCSVANQTGFMDFGFGEQIIRVPWKELVWFAGPGLCHMGLAESDGVSNMLGGTFLRAAYVVFDQDNNNLHLAQAADCGSNLVAIGRGKNAVPDVIGDCPSPSYSNHSPGV
ncbi:uncharacterized protein RAG0_02250 [Rhynchosporium agropyri]|uniref:Peptidase A1 domain-containing protein n=1 Tax=Rhynchosporium agropyri TaxID=914238 RepID=A0A1E1K0R8_9HELO|nr:uncharacterized protein RAG0_02250 [Rhynchosporium agropyri]